MTAHQAITSKTVDLPVNALQNIAQELSSDLSEEANIVMDAVLGALEEKMPEDEFISFCDELEAA